MDLKELLKQYEELEAPILDSMEDETGVKEIVEDYEEDDELGLFIQTDGRLYHKFLEKQIENNEKIAWDRLVREAARLYKKEIDATVKFGEKELQSAKEYIQDYYVDELSEEQRIATGRKYQTLTVKTKNKSSDSKVVNVRVTSVDWDTDDEEADLPQEFDLSVKHFAHNDLDDEVSDAISDKFGFTHLGFQYLVEDFKPAKMKNANYKKIIVKKSEVEKAPVLEEVAEKITFKLGDAEVEVTNDTKETFTAEEILKAIEEENPAIFWNDADAYHYIMDFSFEKNGKKYWIESKHIEGDFSKFELNIYEGFNESLAGSYLNQFKSIDDAKVRNMVEDIKPAEMEQAEYDETKIVKPEVDKNGKKAEKELKEEVEEDGTEKVTVYNKDGSVKEEKKFFQPKDAPKNLRVAYTQANKFAKQAKKDCPDCKVVMSHFDAESSEYREYSVSESVGKELKEEVEEDGVLNSEQQEAIQKAKELYKKHGMLFLDDEEGKEAYDVLYNAGYTMKQSGDVAHCIELNKAGAGFFRESRADKIRKGIHKRVVREEKEQLYGVQFRDMHTAIHNLITTDSKEKAEQILDYLKELENPAEDLDPNAVADNAFITWDLINKLSIDCFEIDYRQVNDGKFEDIIVINADGPKPDIWESVDNKKGEALNETTEADINRMIEKVYGTVGNKKDEYFLQGTTIYQCMEDNGGVKRVLDASTKGKLYDLLCELKAYKNFLVDAGKLNEVKNECLGELKGHKRVKKSKLGESEEYPIKDVIETSDTIKVIVKPEFLELSLIKLFPILELGGNELSDKFIKAIKHIVNGKLIVKYEGGVTRSFTFKPNGSEKNAYNIKPDAGTIFSTVFRVYESMNEVSKDNAEDVNIQKQIKALDAEVKALETGDEKDKEEAEKLADKATKSNKLFKSWKKAKGLEKKDESLNDSVVAKFDNGLHEIVRTADGKYFNRYNIKEGKARFTTRPVNSLPTALGALKKRFPEAEEFLQGLNEDGSLTEPNEKYSICKDMEKGYFYICSEDDVYCDPDGEPYHFETRQEAEEFLQGLNESIKEELNNNTLTC